MSKSVLKKQIVFYISILIISFLALGATMSKVYSNYYIKQKQKELIQSGERISDEYSKYFYTGIINSSKLKYEFQILEDYMNANVFIFNNSGQIAVVSSGIDEDAVGMVLTDENIARCLNGEIVVLEGRMEGIFQNTSLIVGYPIEYNGNVLGGILMYISMPEIQSSIMEVYKGIAAVMVVIFIIGVSLVYFSSKKLLKPILEMNEAAKEIASGNYDKRISIESEDEIGQLGQSFNYMAESIAAQEEKRKDLIANISHDLRSPLTSIQGFVSALLDGTIPYEDQERYLNIVLEESKRLNRIASDLVDLSVIQSEGAKLNLSEFDLNELIRTLIKYMEKRFIDKNAKTELIFAEEKSMVLADKDKIFRVMQNLLDNALKFIESGGRIQIETEIMNDNKIKVFVRDNGEGISDEALRNVFERFFKEDKSRNLDITGGGIGLAIAKDFIKAHGETIGVNSEKGKGAEFYFTLKLV